MGIALTSANMATIATTVTNNLIASIRGIMRSSATDTPQQSTWQRSVQHFARNVCFLTAKNCTLPGKFSFREQSLCKTLAVGAQFKWIRKSRLSNGSCKIAVYWSKTNGWKNASCSLSTCMESNTRRMRARLSILYMSNSYAEVWSASRNRSMAADAPSDLNHFGLGSVQPNITQHTKYFLAGR